MVQINYGTIEEQGFIEIVSKTLTVTFEQSQTGDAREWLQRSGIDLSIRTKDRLDFSKLLLLVLTEVGLNGLVQFLLELKNSKTITSNEARLSLAEGYSAIQLEKAIQHFFPLS